MKIVVSHDVDHLYPSDHIFGDLIFPKLWVRSSIELIGKKISLKTWLFRLISIFDKRLNRIPEILEFDKVNGVKSTFFFGMDNVLGMSYSKKKANMWMKFVQGQDFEIGVHGVEISDTNKMLSEFKSFSLLSGLTNFGIRTHYVRYDKCTFEKMSEIGYLYDTSEFNKDSITPKDPYKIGQMWEFPLLVMDGYIMNGDLSEAKKKTINAIHEAMNQNILYFTFLFHDYMFNPKTYPLDMEYYRWFIEYCKVNSLEFVSYKEAIKELNNERY